MARLANGLSTPSRHCSSPAPLSLPVLRLVKKFILVSIVEAVITASRVFRVNPENDGIQGTMGSGTPDGDDGGRMLPLETGGADAVVMSEGWPPVK